jgi:hypothetical protein
LPRKIPLKRGQKSCGRIGVCPVARAVPSDRNDFLLSSAEAKRQKGKKTKRQKDKKTKRQKDKKTKRQKDKKTKRQKDRKTFRRCCGSGARDSPGYRALRAQRRLRHF